MEFHRTRAGASLGRPSRFACASLYYCTLHDVCRITCAQTVIGARYGGIHGEEADDRPHGACATCRDGAWRLRDDDRGGHGWRPAQPAPPSVVGRDGPGSGGSVPATDTERDPEGRRESRSQTGGACPPNRQPPYPANGGLSEGCARLEMGSQRFDVTRGQRLVHAGRQDRRLHRPHREATDHRRRARRRDGARDFSCAPRTWSGACLTAVGHPDGRERGGRRARYRADRDGSGGAGRTSDLSSSLLEDSRDGSRPHGSRARGPCRIRSPGGDHALAEDGEAVKREHAACALVNSPVERGPHQGLDRVLPEGPASVRAGAGQVLAGSRYSSREGTGRARVGLPSWPRSASSTDSPVKAASSLFPSEAKTFGPAPLPVRRSKHGQREERTAAAGALVITVWVVAVHAPRRDEPMARRPTRRLRTVEPRQTRSCRRAEEEGQVSEPEQRDADLWLELVPTDSLVSELMRRCDCLVVGAVRSRTAEKGEWLVRVKGSIFEVAGIAHYITLCADAEMRDLEQDDPWERT